MRSSCNRRRQGCQCGSRVLRTAFYPIPGDRRRRHATRERSPATTSRCLQEAAAQTARFTIPLYAAARRSADDRSRRALSRAEGQAAARSRRRQASGPVLVACRYRERQGPASPTRCWCTSTDPVDAFFLQIQGSGRVALADGSVVRVGYADQNGHPYRSIAPRADRPRRDHAGSRVDAGDPGMGPAPSGPPPGAARRKPELRVLSRGPRAGTRHAGSAHRRPDRHARRARSLRVARSRSTRARSRSGAPVFIATTLPSAKTPLERLMLAQDTGGAIRGASAPISSGASVTTPAARRAG